MFNFEDLSLRRHFFLAREMSSETESKESRQTIKSTVEKISRDISHASKDIASASKTWAESTGKFVKDTAPKVSSTIDDTIKRASETFEKTMTTIGTETKPQQVKLLKAYRSFLSKQVDLIEKRLQKLKG